MIDEIRKGTDEPNLSHNTPVKKEPNIKAKLDNIVNRPIAEPRFSSAIRSDTQAFATPSVDAA